MPDIKAKLKTYFTGLLSHPACWSNAILLSITTGFEQAWETVVLKCPEKASNDPWYYSNECYSMVFLLGPALALWLLDILGSNVAARMCQGWSNRTDKPKKHCCYISCAVVLRTSVVPLTWVFVALMDGDFYACYNYMPDCAEKDPTAPSTSFDRVEGTNCTKNTTAWMDEKKIESQLYGWIFMVACLLLGSCVVFYVRCTSKRTYFPHVYSTKLTKGERMLIEKSLMEQAETDGKRNVCALMMRFKEATKGFDVTKDPKEPLMTAGEWESICREYTIQECQAATQDQVQYHSPLSEYLIGLVKQSDEYTKRKNAAQSNQNQNPADPPAEPHPNSETSAV